VDKIIKSPYRAWPTCKIRHHSKSKKWFSYFTEFAADKRLVAELYRFRFRVMSFTWFEDLDLRTHAFSCIVWCLSLRTEQLLIDVCDKYVDLWYSQPP